MIPLDALLPAVAEAETRSLIVPPGGALPADTYGFREVYCVDPACDCRRVILNVMSQRTGRHLATISFAFDPDAPGGTPFLDPLNPQSERSDDLLDLAEHVLLADAAYVARLERHYHLVKDALTDPDHEVHERLPVDVADHLDRLKRLAARPGADADPAPAPPFVREEPKVGRNDPCPCGSGRKHKRCCLRARA